MKSSGNSIDKYIEVFCNSLGIKYKRVSESEKESFRKLLKRFPSIKNSCISFRKRKRQSYYPFLQLFNFNNHR